MTDIFTETEGRICLEEILSGLSEDHSPLKDMALSLTGTIAATGHTIAGDEILKNTFANFAFENFEIAAIQIADRGCRGGLPQCGCERP